MSDFGADACDFHSDYASDFCDFPGDSGSDFGSEVRHPRNPWPAWRGPHHQPPRPRHRAGASHRQGHRGKRAAASWQRKRQATAHGATPRHTPTNKAHSAQSGGNIGTAPRVKAPYRCVKIANKAYRKKPPEYTGSKGKPRTACAMRGGGHFWSFARSKSKRIGCNRIYNRIKGGTSLQLRDKDAHIFITDKLA